jgi:hypothetical protein
MSYARRIIRGTVCLGCLLAPGVLSAQAEAWGGFVGTWRRTPRAPLNLLAPKGLITAVYRASDDQVVRLGATYDLAFEGLEGPSLNQLQTARGWDHGPHWILLDREGKVLDEGRVLPSGAALRDHLAATGGTPAWEALERFLEQHPDHGEALQQRVYFACQMARLRLRALRERGLAEGVQVVADSRWPIIVPPKAKDPAAAAGVAREVGESLRMLNRLPDAWRGDWMWLRLWLDLQGSIDPDSFRSELSTFQDGIFEAWLRSPHAGSAFPFSDGAGSLSLADIWMACENLRDARSSYSAAFGLTPTPGRMWPSTDLLNSISASALQKDQASELLARLDGLEAEPPQGTSWGEWVAFRAATCAWHTVVLAQLGRWPEAVSAAQELRRWAGASWGDAAKTLRHYFGPPPGERPVEPVKPGGAPQPFLDLLALPPMEPPPVPAPRPLRFLVLGRPAWAERWKAFRQTPPLSDWGTNELRDEVPAEADMAYLKRLGLPTSGWAVFRGTTELLVRGDGPPDPRVLALQLSAVAPSRLQVLDAFLRQHLDHLDARRERFTLLRPRMPRPEFEERLMEDAVLAGISLDFGPEAPWIRNMDGWRFRARRVLPELEAALHRWPGNAALWRQWTGWSAFLPEPPSALTLAEGLSIYGSRSEWKAGLPLAAHKAIAAEFLRGRRYEDMADWFLEAWKGVSARTVDSRTNPPPEARPQDAVIYESLGAALKSLGRTADLRVIEQAWAKVRKKPEERKL